MTAPPDARGSDPAADAAADPAPGALAPGARTLAIAITGATGFLGSALAARLERVGHRVLRIGRGGGGGAGAIDVAWDPSAGRLDPARLDDARLDAVVHLAGANIGQRWTSSHRREIRESRVASTSLLARTLASLDHRPAVLVSASAVGIYGHRGAEMLDESSSLGSGFLTEVGVAWEGAADPARAAGIRVVHPRSGVVMHPGGGMLARLVPIFSAGAGGKVGSGAQWLSWVSREDWLRAYAFFLTADALDGPVNLTAPAPVTNADFAHTLARVLHRPAIATVPALAVKLMFGEMGEEMLLGGQRVLPRRLLSVGFRFLHPTLEEALRYELRREEGRETSDERRGEGPGMPR